MCIRACYYSPCIFLFIANVPLFLSLSLSLSLTLSLSLSLPLSLSPPVCSAYLGPLGSVINFHFSETVTFHVVRIKTKNRTPCLLFTLYYVDQIKWHTCNANNSYAS